MIFHGTFRMRVPLEDRAPGVVAQVGSVRRCVRQTARCGQGRGRGRTDLSICRRSLGRWALNQLWSDWSATLKNEELTWINQQTWINMLFNHQLTNIYINHQLTNKHVVVFVFIFLGDCMPILWDGHQSIFMHFHSGRSIVRRIPNLGWRTSNGAMPWPWHPWDLPRDSKWFVYVLGSHDISPMDGVRWN